MREFLAKNFEKTHKVFKKMAVLYGKGMLYGKNNEGKYIMKMKGNVLLLSLILLSFLPFSYGIEPWEVIETYCRDGAYKESGNILAYKNKENVEIILVSGAFFKRKIKSIEGAIFVSLENLIALTTNSRIDLDTISNDIEARTNLIQEVASPLTVEIVNEFTQICAENNDTWSAYARKEEKINLGNLQRSLVQYRHTEIQIQALFNAWRKTKRELESSKTPEEKEAKTKKLNILEFLLPRLLSTEEPTEEGVYSLFEACLACAKTEWLRNFKDRFFFKILDNMYGFSKDTRYQSKRFISQNLLEEIKFSDGRSIAVVAEEAWKDPKPNLDTIRNRLIETELFEPIPIASKKQPRTS